MPVKPGLPFSPKHNGHNLTPRESRCGSTFRSLLHIFPIFVTNHPDSSVQNLSVPRRFPHTHPTSDGKSLLLYQLSHHTFTDQIQILSLGQTYSGHSSCRARMMDYIDWKIRGLYLDALPRLATLLRGEYSPRSGFLAIILAAGSVVVVAYFLSYETGTPDVCIFNSKSIFSTNIHMRKLKKILTLLQKNDFKNEFGERIKEIKRNTRVARLIRGYVIHKVNRLAWCFCLSYAEGKLT